MTVAPWHPSQPHHRLAADVRWWMGTPAAFALYGRLALDQVAYREVAAAVDASGRFAENFTNRGIRSGLWGPLLLFGDDSDRQAMANRLKDLHGQVHGRGKGEFAGERYSALNPDLWRWVGTTSMLIFHTGYVTTYGARLSEEEKDVVYATVLHLTDFDLPSERAQIPGTRAEAEAYYDQVADTVLADNEFLQWADRAFDRLPVPTLVGPRWLHWLATPVWRVLTPVLGRPAKVCAEKAAHPRMRELLGVRWTRRREREFRLYAGLIRLARRVLPHWLLLDPLAYNRLNYERIRAFYTKTQLTSFAPPQ